jgi:hypothetical protein
MPNQYAEKIESVEKWLAKYGTTLDCKELNSTFGTLQKLEQERIALKDNLRAKKAACNEALRALKEAHKQAKALRKVLPKESVSTLETKPKTAPRRSKASPEKK